MADKCEGREDRERGDAGGYSVTKQTYIDKMSPSVSLKSRSRV